MVLPSRFNRLELKALHASRSLEYWWPKTFPPLKAGVRNLTQQLSTRLLPKTYLAEANFVHLMLPFDLLHVRTKVLKLVPCGAKHRAFLGRHGYEFGRQTLYPRTAQAYCSLRIHIGCWWCFLTYTVLLVRCSSGEWRGWACVCLHVWRVAQ